MMPPREYLEDDDVSLHSSAIQGGNVNGGKTTATEAKTERETLARNENRIVVYMKLLVATVLLLTSFFVSSRVYSYIRDDQTTTFKAAFDADAHKLLEVFKQKIQNQIEALDTLSVAITSHALSSNSAWPNVTLPHFAERFAHARVGSGSFMMSYQPLVTDETRSGWEAYFMENIDHFRQGLDDEFYLEEAQNAQYDPELTTSFSKHKDPLAPTVPFILQLNPDGNFSKAEKGAPFRLPLWQMSPVPVNTEALNLDATTHPMFAVSVQQSIQSGLAVLGDASFLISQQLQDTGGYFTMLLRRSQYRNGLEVYKDDAMSSFVYPVFDKLNLKTRKPAGALISVLYWRLLFKGVLPDKEYTKRGLVCVLSNSLGQTHSYRIDNTVTYLGDGDRHDAKYNGMSHSCSTTRAMEIPMERKSLTSVALDVDHNSYTLTIYPSQDTEDEFVNHDAFKATVVILLVFCVTSIVFILYTLAVGLRQRVVMDRAVASGAIVSSLFPSQVRAQIYQECLATDPATAKKSTVVTEDGTSESNAAHMRPIANVYEQTTILFADMVGFTKWSSTRQPVQVFELLETLYKAFDAIAVRRKVFKVETIGDCYVAVAGLPDPQDNHAAIMVKFADACMTKMKQLTTELADSLGADTAELAMRVGLHSGSVTGGVLRGQKSRFQLFGDTMNTASRMESNGMPGRIHVSQETANELVAKGKSAWISAREDKIVAKGKGKLQTYWVNPRSIASAATSVSDSGNRMGYDQKRPATEEIATPPAAAASDSSTGSTISI